MESAKVPIRVVCFFVSIAVLLCSLPGCSEMKNNQRAAECTMSDTSSDDTLVVACDKFTGIFNPLYATNESDTALNGLTQELLFDLDREGNIVSKGMSGETRPYNGTDYTYYGIADCDIEYEGENINYIINLREDVFFSDGVNMTADDVIFTMYVMADPSYNGVEPFYTLPIKGMEEYRSGVADVKREDISETANKIKEAGRYGTVATNSSAESSIDIDETLYDEYWQCVDEAWMESLSLISEFCATNYPDYLSTFGNNETALAMYGWGFADYSEEGLTGQSTGTVWTLTGEDFPDEEDFFEETMERFSGDADEFYQVSLTGLQDESVYEKADDKFAVKISEKFDSTEQISSISGIVKTGKYSLTVTMSECSAVSMYALAVSVLPLHYYGSLDLYDYENNKFGFVKGDLKSIKNKNQLPLGAGPYVFYEYSDGLATLKRNEYYYKGVPEIENVVMPEINSDDIVDSVLSGLADIAAVGYGSEDIDKIAEANSASEEEISGNVLYTARSAVQSYGYIGINADNVKVGEDKGSHESKALRKAFATLFAVYRDIAVSSYFASDFGCMADVIEYPVPDESWISPKATDEDFCEAFSVDKDGSMIYQADFDEDDRYAAALEAATEFLKEAGYVFDDTKGIFVEAPHGAALEYTAVIPAGGTKAHPSYYIADYAASALAEIGITLNVIDVADESNLWNALDEGECDMWAAAWGKSADPDLYQLYYSECIPGKGGSDCNFYGIEDSALDNLIIQGRQNTDSYVRKSIYKECFDIIMDWGVEVPVFTMDMINVFSVERINTDTVTPDITAFWSWTDGIELLEMN